MKRTFSYIWAVPTGSLFGRTATVLLEPTVIADRAGRAWRKANQELQERATREGRQVEPDELLEPITLHADAPVVTPDHEIRPPSLLALPSYLAGNVARIGHRLLLRALAERDLRLQHAAILAALYDFGPLAQHELADRLDVQQSHLVGCVDLLEQRVLVQRERDHEDRRRQNVALTTAGRALWRRLQRVAERFQAQFLDVLSESERETLLALLYRVLRAHDEARQRAVV